MIGCWLLGDCSTEVTPTYDMNGFGQDANLDSDYFEAFNDVCFYYINY